jgi:hypothetical protein
MTLSEAKELLAMTSASQEVAECFMEALFRDAMTYTSTEELDALGIGPGVFVRVALLGLLRIARTRGFDFEDQLEEARLVESRVQLALETLRAAH